MIMKNNPFPVIIPCHRVVKFNGEIGGYVYGEKIKSNMLSKEGITIKDGKILDFDIRKTLILIFSFCWLILQSRVLICAIFLTVFPPIFLVNVPKIPYL